MSENALVSVSGTLHLKGLWQQLGRLHSNRVFKRVHCVLSGEHQGRKGRGAGRGGGRGEGRGAGHEAEPGRRGRRRPRPRIPATSAHQSIRGNATLDHFRAGRN